MESSSCTFAWHFVEDVRAMRRQGDTAVRRALGAGRWQIARAGLLEGLLLATTGGAIALAVATAVVRVLRLARPDHLPRAERLEIDGTALVATLVSTLLVALLVGLLRNLRMLRPTSGALRAGSATGDGTAIRWRAVLVVGQIALAVSLLIGTGLMVRTVANLHGADPGFEVDRTLTTHLSLDMTAYPEVGDRARFYRSLIDTIAGQLGVVSVGGGDPLPLDVSNRQWTISAEGLARAPEGGLRSEAASVTPGYFRTLGIPLLAGRLFESLFARSIADETWLARTLVGFGIIAAGLALLGLYGLVAYAMLARQRETCIRLALGARRTRCHAGRCGATCTGPGHGAGCRGHRLRPRRRARSGRHDQQLALRRRATRSRGLRHRRSHCAHGRCYRRRLARLACWQERPCRRPARGLITRLAQHENGQRESSAEWVVGRRLDADGTAGRCSHLGCPEGRGNSIAVRRAKRRPEARVLGEPLVGLDGAVVPIRSLHAFSSASAWSEKSECGLWERTMARH